MRHEALTNVLDLLDTLASISRALDPWRIGALAETIGDRDAALQAALAALDPRDPVAEAATLALRACAALRAAADADNPMVAAYRALRQHARALEALAPLAVTDTIVSRYFIEPDKRDDAALARRLAAPPHPESGLFHSENDTRQRGGFSLYVPATYDPAHPAPVIAALHGGAGHGRLFLWNWLPIARSRGAILIAPTATGDTWSLMDPDKDTAHLTRILAAVRARWSVDTRHLLLTGMSDGGTFTLLSGLDEAAPFTHLAPVAASFHPMLLAMTSPARLTGLPIHLTHGARDWMFPVDQARLCHRMLAAAGAKVTYREIADLAHAYPSDRQHEVADWWLTETPPDETGNSHD